TASPPASPAVPTSADDLVTAYGARMGTPGYAAPELLEGLGADATSDVFSLGVVLYELVVGDRPFHGRTYGEIRAAILAADFVPASVATDGAVAPAFDAAIARAMAFPREARFPTPVAFAAAAAAAIPGAPARPRRRAAYVAVAVAAALAAIAIPLRWL